MMFHVKICGVQREDEVRFVAACGADAVGLNFFPSSVRYLDPNAGGTQNLATLAKQQNLFVVAVVVNRSAESIAELCQLVQLDAIQLHGDESIEDLRQIRKLVSLPILRAIKLPRNAINAAEIQRRVEPWCAADCHLLLDADAGKAHGGSGKTLDWDSVAAWAKCYPGTSWTLAGGLNPGNVAEAMRRTGARSIDTASGVERPRGVKNAELTAEFCQAAGLV